MDFCSFLISEADYYPPWRAGFRLILGDGIFNQNGVASYLTSIIQRVTTVAKQNPIKREDTLHFRPPHSFKATSPSIVNPKEPHGVYEKASMVKVLRFSVWCSDLDQITFDCRQNFWFNYGN